MVVKIKQDNACDGPRTESLLHRCRSLSHYMFTVWGYRHGRGALGLGLGSTSSNSVTWKAIPPFLLYNGGDSVYLERLETICILCLAHVDT